MQSYTESSIHTPGTDALQHPEANAGSFKKVFTTPTTYEPTQYTHPVEHGVSTQKL